MNTHCKNGVIGGAILAITYPAILIILVFVSDVYWESGIPNKIMGIALLPLMPVIVFSPMVDISGGPVLKEVVIIIMSTLAYLFSIGFIVGAFFSLFKERFIDDGWPG